MPEINLMLNGKALIDQSTANLSPWDGRVDFIAKKMTPVKTPVKFVQSSKKQPPTTAFGIPDS
jgi:hypothetical protein